MKRTLIITILTFGLLTVAHGSVNRQEAQNRFLEANAAYDSGDYNHAAEIYSALCDEGWQSWEVYYNLGNAHYRMDEIAQSILNYERALRLAPNKKVIKDNLALARSKTVDNIEELPRLFLWQWVDAAVQMTTPYGWRIIVIILIVLLSASICIFFIAKDYHIRKPLFVTNAVLLLLLIISVFNATISARKVSNDTEAIVMKPLLVVKGSPDAKSVDKFVLHEGTKLTITDRQDHWWQIEIADGKNGWISDGAETI